MNEILVGLAIIAVIASLVLLPSQFPRLFDAIALGAAIVAVCLAARAIGTAVLS